MMLIAQSPKAFFQAQRGRGSGRPEQELLAAEGCGYQVVGLFDHGTANSLAQAFPVCQALSKNIFEIIKPRQRPSQAWKTARWLLIVLRG